MSVLKPIADGAIVAKRNLIKIKRVPDLLVFSTISPIMFILLFAYVFGSAIHGAGHQLPRVPDPGHLRPDGDLRRHPDRRRHGRRHEEGHHRPVPVAADVTLGGADRAHRQRRGQQRPDHRGDVADRPDRRLADPQLGRRGHRRLPAAAGVRLRDLVDHGLGRAHRAERRGGQQRLVRGDLPAHLHRQHLRADQQLPDSAEVRRQLEPGVVGDPGRPTAVRQRPGNAPSAGLLVAATPGRSTPSAGCCCCC